MSSLSLIQKLASHSTQQTADFAPDRCLRKRLTSCDCAECIDACTSGAITVDDGGISFDTGACSGCMLCAKACPNDAFTFSEFDAGSLCMEEYKAEIVVISCHQQSQIYPEERLVPCLGGIATEHLLALAMFGESTIAFNVSSCADCQNNRGVTDFLNSLAWLKQKRGSIFKRKCVVITEQKEIVALDQSVRRSFLSGLRYSLYETIGSQFSFHTDSFKPAARTSRRIPARVKIKKQLMEKVASKDKQALSSLINHQLIINKACNVCPLCKGICPTGAIKIERVEQQKQLTFDDTLCSGCGLCVSFCKKNALSLKKPDSWELAAKTAGQSPLVEDLMPLAQQITKESKLESV